MTTPRDDIAGLTKAQGYADSLRQQARWIEEALDDATPQHKRVDIGDIDTDELKEAATQLDALSARVKELENDIIRQEYNRLEWIRRSEAEKSRALRAEQERDKYERLYHNETVERLRAEQERDEAYERAAKVADQWLESSWVDEVFAARSIADAIRRLSAGPEKEKK